MLCWGQRRRVAPSAYGTIPSTHNTFYPGAATCTPASERGASLTPEGEQRLLNERRALELLDAHYALQLRCPAGDLRRPGWSFAAPPDPNDPLSLLFGRRALLSLVAPVAAPAAIGRAGVVACVPDLRPVVAALLREWSPEALFTPSGLRALEDLIATAEPLLAPFTSETHHQLHFALPAEFQPYLGRWLDWLEPLDESVEVDPTALSLLARFGGGVYVVRNEGAIYAFAGLRSTSAHVSEIFSLATAPQEISLSAEADDTPGLARAVTSRATRAAFAAGHIPLYATPATHHATARMLQTLGYRLYADTLTLTSPT